VNVHSKIFRSARYCLCNWFRYCDCLLNFLGGHMMTILFTFLCSFSASYFFNVIYDAPKKLFFPAGFAGSMGYFVSYILEQSFEMDSIYSSLLGSLTLGLLAHIMSRIFKAPVVLFMIPGIIP